ncbi:EAL domain-containing protein [Sagittula sp. SSi028]|uniref:bifunctional diguanylate cyclase/phosphodiesterase n=1 Tax=Sagittula sp. SSi028 TaxID=3400636 RepID=UPI003AF56A29
MGYTKEGALDLEACEREPIHSLGAIQPPYAAALFCPKTKAITAFSANLPELTGFSKQALCDLQVTKLLTHWPEAFDRLGQMDVDAIPVKLGAGTECMAWVRSLGDSVALVIDTEQAVSTVNAGFASVLRFSRVVERALETEEPDIGLLCADVAQTVYGILGFDRVMVYQFDTDWNGHVIAEHAAPHVDTHFLGLTFPSSDIPKPARALFLRNRVRPLPDVDATPIPLICCDGSPASDLDIGTLSERAVSPIHLEYLRNMGVRASLTIAVIVGGKLWGLLACHHHSGPRRLAASDLDLCRVLCDLLSNCLSTLTERRSRKFSDDAETLARAMRQRVRDIDPTCDLSTAFAPFESEMLDLLQADGAIWQRDTTQLRFGTAKNTSFDALMDTLALRAEATSETTFQTNHLTAYFPDLGDPIHALCAGVSYAYNGDEPGSLLALRPPQDRMETWAGDPAKRASATGRLRPRNSFELWQARTKDKSAPWDEAQTNRTIIVKTMLSEIVWILRQRRSELEAHNARITAEAARQEMEHNALHDALTGLPNRWYLNRHLQQVAEINADPSAYVAALHIDLDRFKSINDRFGHAVGDAVLRHVANRLNVVKRAEDFAARLGGDEFVIIAHNTPDREDLERLCADIIGDLARPFEIKHQIFEVGASIGVDCAALSGLDRDALLARADTAMYESKRNGRGQVSFVSERMAQLQSEKNQLADDILIGLKQQQFQFFFQLQYDAVTRNVVGAEALIRWDHPTRGLMPPMSFLPLAVEIGAMGALDALAVDAAVAARQMWQDAGFYVPKVSVNISAQRLAEMDVSALIKRYPHLGDIISFELLEVLDLNEIDETSVANIERARAQGISLEIDDFGTGHTSILGLIRLKPNRIKIDKNLVIPAVQSATAREVVRSIVAIARSLNIGITAEGVETEAHASLMQRLGCDTLQGYGLAVPMNADRVITHMQHGANRAVS